MKHASTRIVYEYWNKVRGDRLAPARVEIDPSNMRHALSDTFLLAADFVDQLRFRLAGTPVCALFGREIKGEAFAELWGETSRKIIEEQLVILTHEASGLVAGVSARTEDGAQTNLELLLLPLAQVGHTRVRAIGVLAPLGPPFLAGRPSGRRARARRPAPSRHRHGKPAGAAAIARHRGNPSETRICRLQRQPRKRLRRADRLTPR